jgi:death-on-curing family protein
MNKIEIFTSSNNQTQVEVKFDKNTLWLNQKQIAEVFGTEVPAINKHIKNVIKEGELRPEATISNLEIVQIEGKRNITRKVDFYNLDMIISVGYRVNSSKATQFRIWATERLKEHLTQGYTINQKRLDQLQQTIQLISQQNNNLDNLGLTEAKGLLEIIKNYSQSFILLNQFDSHNLKTDHLNQNITYEIKYEEAVEAIKELKKQLMAKKEATELFGNPKDQSFQGILGNIVQSFGGEYLYKSIEEQAANLLYFVIKNHPFSDGNKRIGAFMFVWFLEKNKHRFKKNGELKINDNALVALALLVAQSNPAEKELMVQLVINLIKS